MLEDNFVCLSLVMMFKVFIERMRNFMFDGKVTASSRFGEKPCPCHVYVQFFFLKIGNITLLKFLQVMRTSQVPLVWKSVHKYGQGTVSLRSHVLVNPWIDQIIGCEKNRVLAMFMSNFFFLKIGNITLLKFFVGHENFTGTLRLEIGP